MGCIYSANSLDNAGKCYFAEDQMNNLVPKELMPNGCDEKGFCSAEDDPDPSWCDSYESDGNDDGYDE